MSSAKKEIVSLHTLILCLYEILGKMLAFVESLVKIRLEINGLVIKYSLEIISILKFRKGILIKNASDNMIPY